ncbi:Acetyl-CoA hydrolase/transferase [Syntrophomonas zehnderi OL-4]|uniref:Acetyl-CoA hydrolase/transferase n=1 Tax=Syntrophomonas zehnderi OL-4 TaxID=690567 RepID=A0A0E3W2I2_9FIRM|nr:acetyl-CoA hydrolase/transferase C-terminal domain-containing protein [Syntrophomonas zehnderi]CFX01904.1 Acetyl-CoA hydrolase/transferase [Syntrophomonas zehnderi OL-4]
MSTYMEEYKSKLITAEKAAQLVQSDDLIEYGAFNTKPVDFDIALGKRAGDGLQRVSVRGSGTVPPIPQIIQMDPKGETFQYYNWYYTALDRAAAEHGLCNYVTVNYHEALSMFGNEKYYHTWPDIWIAQVTPMDNNGCFNFGIGNSHSRSCALFNRRLAIVEVNENLPYCPGGNAEYVHISEIDYIIEGSNSPIFCSPPADPASPEEEKIANYIMEEIHDGCLIQLGIGSMPNLLGNKIAHSGLKDLGVQTEMFSDCYVEMYKHGCITNRKKAFDLDKSTYTFCLGTQETYDFLNGNPRCASVSCEYSNNPIAIAQHENVISINNIIELDLLSQVSSETNGLRQISGIGGQMDWTFGAFHSKGGKGILAFTSTYKDKDGNLKSRIKPLLTTGSIVSVTRPSVHYLVTENGIVNMKSKSAWARTEAVINLAHPEFRDDLLKSAKEMGIWSRTNRNPC